MKRSLDGLLALAPRATWKYPAKFGSAAAMADARSWIDHSEAQVRARAFDLLGSVALNHPQAADALAACLEAGPTDAEATVRRAVGRAIGDLADLRLRPWLRRLVQDSDTEVRTNAIAGLPRHLDDPPPDHPDVVLLVDLLGDPEVAVRDWAAFALGTPLEVDSPAIRAALRSLLSEPDSDDNYPAAEAALGLPRRGDQSALHEVARRLRQPGPGLLWLDAAAELGRSELLPALRALREDDDDPDDPWVEQCDEAIRACTENQGGPPSGGRGSRPPT